MTTFIQHLDTLSLRQNDRHIIYMLPNAFSGIDNYSVLIMISLKLVSKVTIYSIGSGISAKQVTGDKWLRDSKLTEFYAAMSHH